MSVPAIIQVEKESTLADYVKNTFVLPASGARIAAKEAAALLTDANPHLGEEKHVRAGTVLMVPPGFPLDLREGTTVNQLGARIDGLSRLRSALATIVPDEQGAMAASRNEHEMTSGLLDLAATIEAGRERSEQIEHIRAAADEKLRRAGSFQEARRERVEQLKRSLQELADSLGAGR